MAITVLLSGLYLVSLGLIMQTENLRSSIVFKVIPFISGLGNLVVAGKMFGWF